MTIRFCRTIRTVMAMSESQDAGGDSRSIGTVLKKQGIKKRMRCSSQAASRIEDTFVTAEQLVEAVLSEQPLTENDGIGAKTAEVIEEWWENRFEREEEMGSSSLERTGAKTASIYFHSPWEDVLETEDAEA